MLKILGKQEIEIDINGEKRKMFVRPADTLLRALREQLGLTGAKVGCENGDCGTCTVLVDGWPIKSCLMLAVEAIGHKVITVEGLKNADIGQTFIDSRAFQCGYCTPGFIMNSYGLVNIHPDAKDAVIIEWLESNICRCTGGQEIKNAVKKALKHKNAELGK